MPPRTIQYSFAHGECSDEFLGGRQDLQRYYSSCRTLENYLPLLTGGVTRAPGTRLIATAKGPGRVRLKAFEFSIEQAYMLEFGGGYLRIYKDDGRLENPPGTPIEVATPYPGQDLFALQFVQSADVLYIVHPRHAVRTLLRLSETEWVLALFRMRPEPVIDEDYAPPGTLTPSATSGDITLTASTPVFLESDLDRQIRGNLGLATITAVPDTTPATTVQARTSWPFRTTTPIPQGQWFLVGSPVADLTPSKTTPIGGRTVLSLSSTEKTGPNLLPPSGWTDLSGEVITTGTATGGTVTTLIDTTKNFFTLGVNAGVRVLRTAGGEGRADTTGQTTNPGDTVTMNPGLTGGFVFNAGDAYTIRRSGSAVISPGGQLSLNPGENGVAVAEQEVPVLFGKVYEVEFTVQGQPITAQVGTTSGLGDLFAETTFAPGTQSFQFTAQGTDVHVQFRNSQSPLSAQVTGITMHLISVDGWRTSDLGSYVQVFDGTVELTRLLDPSRAEGTIWWPLKPDQLKGAPIPTALAGAWTLMRPAWTLARGFPRTVSFYQGRLAFAGSPLLSVFLSANGLYDNFALGTDDDQAVFLTISANKMNAIEWLEPLRDLLIGTRGTEHVIRGGERGITPSSFEQVPLPTENGSHPIRPAKMGTVLYQLGRGGRNLYEVQLDAELNRVTQVRDVLTDARHITMSGIRQLAVQNKPIKRLWLTRNDGQAVCFTADLSEDVRGFARRITQGRIESIETVPIDEPGATEVTEAVWLSVDRNGIRTIERMEPGLTLDSALTYTGPAVSTVTGLAHLEGQVVGVLNNGAYETHLVKDGAVDLDRPGTDVTVGLEYVCTLGLPRPELQLRDGTLQTLRKHIVQASVRLKDSMGLQVNGEVVPFRRTFDRMDAAAPAQDLDISQHLRGWTQDGEVTLTQTLPFPSTILSVVLEMEFEETT